MKVNGPILSVGAVAALGTAIFLINAAAQDTSASSPGTAVVASTTVAAAPPAPPAPPRASFPAKADYIAEIPTRNGTLTLDIAVAGSRAVAYACDGRSIESWLKGTATGDTVSLAGKDGTSRLEGRLEGSAITGTLRIGAASWDFTAAEAPPPAGLYAYEQAGARNSWILDPTGSATGVRRGADGSLTPASVLTPQGTAVVDGRDVAADRVEGDSDDI
jgi:hypothetical protein